VSGVRLVVVGPASVAVTPLEPGARVVVGRAVEADLRIDDRKLSRAHLAVTRRAAGGVEVEDLGSRNGTIVAGTRLAPHVGTPLASDEVCVLGSQVVWVDDDDGPHWTDAASFDEAVRAGRGALRVLEVRAAASASTETAHVLAGEAHEEVTRLAVLRRGLRARLSGAPRSGAFVTRRATGAVRLAVPDEVATGLAGGAPGDAWGFELVAPVASWEPGLAVTASSRAPRESSPLARPLVDRDRIAQSDVTVLLHGETGAGKEVAARDLHARSRRAHGPFVVVNCASIVESLFEAELFGHEKGAFTGAVGARRGYFEAANGGTLFLDEIAELPKTLQAKLLRVVEERAVVRVGGSAPEPVDVRILAATHRDLSVEVAEGRFREDLYFRLCGVVLRIPPLRERRGEIPGLVRELLARHSDVPIRVSDGAMAALLAHAWPGNVRELRAVLERALLVCAGTTLEPSDIVFETPLAAASRTPTTKDEPDDRRSRIRAALEATHGNQTKAAERLGVTRRTLTNWLNELGLPRPRKG
jgi:transcriptional regulator of acetoin/glycerol metabolism